MGFCARFATISILVPLSFTVAACHRDDSSGKPVDPCVARAEAYQALVDDVRKKLDLKGTQLAIMTPECGLWTGASGESTDTQHLLATQVLRVGSTTKSFVAGTILHLVSEGKLGLDDKLDKFVPDFPRANEYTIRHLLNHTSKISSYTSSSVFLERLRSEPGRTWTSKELLDIAAHEMQTNPTYMKTRPGEEFEYSNTNYILLGLILEKVTGQSVARAIRAQVLEPLKLENTSFAGEEPVVGDLAHGYDVAGVDVTTKYDPSIAWTSGAMVSNAKDLVTWAGALYGGSFLPQALHDDMVTPTKASETDMEIGESYALGTRVYHEPLSKVRIWGHPGDFFGYHTLMGYIPDKKTTFTVIVNQDEKHSYRMLLTRLSDITDVILH